MRFFTREWKNGELTDEEYDAVVPAYWQHYAEIASKLPTTVQQFSPTISLHDGLPWYARVDRTALTLEIISRCGDQQVGYFDLALRYRLTSVRAECIAAVARMVADSEAEMFYDEFDLAPHGQYVHRILLWPTDELAIEFSEFSYECIARPDREVPAVAERFVDVG